MKARAGLFVEHFRIARDTGWAVTVHGGEAGPGAECLVSVARFKSNCPFGAQKRKCLIGIGSAARTTA